MQWFKCQLTNQVFAESDARWLEVNEGIYAGYSDVARFMLCPCCNKDEWRSIEPCQTCLERGEEPREACAVFEHCREHMLEIDADELTDYEREVA